MSDDLHRVVVKFDDGTYLKELIHPETGCATGDRCGQCGRGFDADDDSTPCYDCPSEAQKRECWVTGWFDNLSADELLSGRVEIVVRPEFNDDTCVLHVVEAKAIEG